MPRQGNTVESCILVEWKVNEGDIVNEETLVCSVETDKAAFEVPAGAGGTVLKILRAAGDDVPVLEPIAVIGAAGENWQGQLTVGGANTQETSHKGTEAQRHGDEVKSTKDGLSSQIKKEQDSSLESSLPAANRRFDVPPCEINSEKAISPRARTLAEKEALPLPVPGTGPDGRIIERDIKTALENRPALTAAAKAAGPTAIPAAGTGIAGRVTAEDLEIPKLVSPAVNTAVPRPPVPIKGIRKIISDKMHKSLAETAQFTLNASAPVSRLQEIRSRMKNSGEDFGLSKITVNDLILFAVSRVLPRFPYMNAHKTGDTVNTFEHVSLSMAVDTPRGLMVPVIHNANSLPLAKISSEAKRLAAACQNGSAKPEELSGSTFTVTNLGSLGITSFTPILNFPEVAILGVCNIELKPAAQDESGNLPPALLPYIGFSLTINHQVVDGAPAARFLKALCETIADIDLLLFSEGV
jgi:pyruvate dehydrogenase E2 component (dihydrolipoamide acetyltransferase)